MTAASDHDHWDNPWDNPNDSWVMYAHSQGRSPADQFHHDVATFSLCMKGYVNWIRSNHPGNRRADGSLIHPTLP